MARPTLRYLPGLDGIRALAVAGVLCYHAGFGWASGGWLGVDAFFVLSGFLITSLLLSEWRGANAIDLPAFWARRARRLLPALLLVLAAVALYAVALAAPTELRRIRSDGIASLFYVANWRSVFSGQSYFEQFGVPSPLRHFWSLAIEEQFYLVWPLVVTAVLRWRRGSVRALAGFTAIAAVGSAVVMAILYNPGHDPSRVYYGTDTRAQSLLIGALWSIVWLRRPVISTTARRWALHGAAVVAVVVLGWCWSTATERSEWLYRGGFAWTALLVVVVIASVVQPRAGPVGIVFAAWPMRAIGKISYGLYLWHWPVYVALSPTRVNLSQVPLFGVRMAVTFTLSIASYVFVEEPIRRGAWRGWRIRVATPVAFTTVLAVLLVVTAGAPPALREVAAADVSTPTETIHPAGPGATEPTRILVVGDSVANSLAPGLERVAEANSLVVWNATVPGCGLASDEGDRLMGDWIGPDPRCVPGWRARWPRHVAHWDPDIVVVLLGTQDTYDRRIDGHEYLFDTADGAALARRELEEAADILSAGGARVVLLTTPYYVLGWPQRLTVERSYLNADWIDRWNALLVEVASRDPESVMTLDLNRVIDPGGQWTWDVDGVRVRDDDRVHLSSEGADLATRWLLPHLRALEK